MGPETARVMLGVSPEASRRDVDRAFRQLVRSAHPDRGGDPAHFRRLVAARIALAEGRRGSARTPLIVIRTAPWWRRLLTALVDHVEARRGRPPAPPRVT